MATKRKKTRKTSRKARKKTKLQAVKGGARPRAKTLSSGRPARQQPTIVLRDRTELEQLVWRQTHEEAREVIGGQFHVLYPSRSGEVRLIRLYDLSVEQLESLLPKKHRGKS